MEDKKDDQHGNNKKEVNEKSKEDHKKEMARKLKFTKIMR